MYGYDREIFKNVWAKYRKEKHLICNLNFYMKKLHKEQATTSKVAKINKQRDKQKNRNHKVGQDSHREKSRDQES